MKATYKKNHASVDVRGDVCSANYDEIREKYGKIDVVIGGLPCQAFQMLIVRKPCHKSK